MKRLTLLLLLLSTWVSAQEFYVIDATNRLYTVDPQNNFSKTELFQIDVNDVGGIVAEIAFSSEGLLYGITFESKRIIEIDLVNETAAPIGDQPFIWEKYRTLVGTDDNRLLFGSYTSGELYSFDIPSGTITTVASGIFSSADFTFYKGNLIFPFVSDPYVMKAFDGSSIVTIGCDGTDGNGSLNGFINYFDSCNSDLVYAIANNGVVYEFNFETEALDEVGQIPDIIVVNGAAFPSEYMADSCLLENLSISDCDILSTDDLNAPRISIAPNPAAFEVRLSSSLPLPDSSYMLFDINGRKLLSGSVAQEQALPLGTLHSGMYFLRVFDGENKTIFQEKIIKN
ncbi:T9SS type A sorting domain-containing protein [Aureisphaera galaxeae]|uniref:T9SS type A sorting domain-containing protein n=1 Tax=Aureisphaera galaxeae TaxID=1538023 RepID=UPI00234FC09B|nr:T9SS type A sorting domain-containing protein [Aureisphaera galaxeae]MDC8003494.1 T9SS type A sorting domain-containing protein [Aureisphaera galaxeae]